MKPYAFFFVIFLSLSLALATEEAIKQKKKQYAEECKTKLKTTTTDAAILTKAVVPSTDGEKCLLECIYEKFGVIKNGKLDIDKAKELAKARFTDQDHLKKANDVIDKCKTDVETNSSGKCGYGKAIRHCIITYGQNVAVFFKN